MPYAYQAEMWCDSCGEAIIADLKREGVEDTGDTDDYPQYAPDDEESDSPDQCAAGPECLEAVELSSGEKMGAMFGSLTTDGVGYVQDAYAEAHARTDQFAPRSQEITELWADFFGVDVSQDDEDDE